MQGLKRRVVYITLYEAIAIAATSAGLALMSGQGLGHSGVLAVISSVIAVLWNLAFNTLFERWEARQAVRGRSVRRRIAHAIGFEGGLAGILVPIFAWWLGVGLWQALAMDFGLVLFFLVYTFVFNWVFDAVFGLPASAAAQGPALNVALER
ncbi:MAG: PACE efflux transporter [Variovorax sp.]|nr:PACE efflux transporter [Variovorax sp.]